MKTDEKVNWTINFPQIWKWCKYWAPCNNMKPTVLTRHLFVSKLVCGCTKVRRHRKQRSLNPKIWKGPDSPLSPWTKSVYESQSKVSADSRRVARLQDTHWQPRVAGNLPSVHTQAIFTCCCFLSDSHQVELKKITNIKVQTKKEICVHGNVMVHRCPEDHTWRQGEDTEKREAGDKEGKQGERDWKIGQKFGNPSRKGDFLKLNRGIQRREL